MTALDLEPLTVTVAVREDPPRLSRVGNSRVLLELVIRAFKSAEEVKDQVRLFPLR